MLCYVMLCYVKFCRTLLGFHRPCSIKLRVHALYLHTAGSKRLLNGILFGDTIYTISTEDYGIGKESKWCV